MNGCTLIRKELKKLGYYMTFVETQGFIYHCGFHGGEWYALDVYRTSNGYYIKFKPHDKPRYYLCTDKDDLKSVVSIAFSQRSFIESIKEYFPK